MPETAFTVWTNMVERGRLAAGEAVLVHGGTSGIGTTAIQLARALGARVFATAGSAEKCAACESLGAERAFNYREVDFVEATRQATDGRGVDLVLDIVGGDYFQRNLEVLGMDGRLVLIGQIGGHRSQISTTPIFRKRLTITGSILRARSVAEKGVIARAVQPARLAADRIRGHSRVDPRDLPAGPGVGGAPGDGRQPAHRQARPDP